MALALLPGTAALDSAQPHAAPCAHSEADNAAAPAAPLCWHGQRRGGEEFDVSHADLVTALAQLDLPSPFDVEPAFDCAAAHEHTDHPFEEWPHGDGDGDGVGGVDGHTHVVPDVDEYDTGDVGVFFEIELLPRDSVEEVERWLPGHLSTPATEGPCAPIVPPSTSFDDIESDLKMTAGLFPLDDDAGGPVGAPDACGGGGGGGIISSGAGPTARGTGEPADDDDDDAMRDDRASVCALPSVTPSPTEPVVTVDHRSPTARLSLSSPLLGTVGLQEDLRWHPAFAAVVRFLTPDGFRDEQRRTLPGDDDDDDDDAATADAAAAASAAPFSPAATLDQLFASVRRIMSALAGVETAAAASRDDEWRRVRSTLAASLEAAARRSTKRRPASGDASPDSGSGGSSQGEQRRGQKLNPAATRILREWISARQDNPYPDEDEKDELSLQTGLRIEQLNNWFINARRRLLKKLKPPQ